MNQKMQRRNIVLITTMLVISAATAWLIYSLMKQQPLTPAAVMTQPSTESRFNILYEKRLEEEGNRTARVENLIQTGELADSKARYYKIGKEQVK